MLFDIPLRTPTRLKDVEPTLRPLQLVNAIAKLSYLGDPKSRLAALPDYVIQRAGTELGNTIINTTGKYNEPLKLRGALTTRLAALYRNYGYPLTEDQKKLLADTIAALKPAPATPLWLEINDTIDWEGGAFGDSREGCWFEGGAYRRTYYKGRLSFEQMMKEGEAFAVRFFTDEETFKKTGSSRRGYTAYPKLYDWARFWGVKDIPLKDDFTLFNFYSREGTQNYEQYLCRLTNHFGFPWYKMELDLNQAIFINGHRGYTFTNRSEDEREFLYYDECWGGEYGEDEGGELWPVDEMEYVEYIGYVHESKINSYYVTDVNGDKILKSRALYGQLSEKPYRYVYIARENVWTRYNKVETATHRQCAKCRRYFKRTGYKECPSCKEGAAALTKQPELPLPYAPFEETEVIEWKDKLSKR